MMKPIILKADRDGKILITAEEIEKIVTDVYDEGYRDGRASCPIITTTPELPINVPGSTPWWDHITCDVTKVTL